MQRTHEENLLSLLMQCIYYFSEDIIFSLKAPDLVRKWIINVINKENYLLKHLNFIFCSNAYLQKKNQQYLQHNTLTDVLTFNQSEADEAIQGDIYISIERVKENAMLYATTFDNELFRVMIHGVLHLIGYNDQSKEAKKIMRQQENQYLTLFD